MSEVKGKRILIVEDDEDIVELLMIVVGEENNRIDIAANGSDALAKIKCESNYDLIISDFHMPLMNGIQLHQQIRAINAQQAERMFFISGEQLHFDLGVRVRFLLKPFGIKDLRQQIVKFFNEQS
jgi:CheY-like chemotaxis protein